jgi:hypothetical protein
VEVLLIYRLEIVKPAPLRFPEKELPSLPIGAKPEPEFQLVVLEQLMSLASL